MESSRSPSLRGAILWLIIGVMSAAFFAVHGCKGDVQSCPPLGDGSADAPVLPCMAGTDGDHDGFGEGCPSGPDCDDHNPNTNPGAVELCDGIDNNCNDQIDEGVKNACGTCDPGCEQVGADPFPLEGDPHVRDVNGVVLNPDGDLVLGQTKKAFNYMWIANTHDLGGRDGGCRYATEADYNPGLDALCRGTVSKIDTTTFKEVGRYYTTTCKPQVAECQDVNGRPFVRDFPHTPSRTAVDYNFDVWVANRAFGGQPTVTKIANDPSDCEDRNGNGKIDTSEDLNVSVRVRTADSEASWGEWQGPFHQTPIELEGGATPADPNPAVFLQVEFTLVTSDKAVTPVLKEFNVLYACNYEPD